MHASAPLQKNPSSQGTSHVVATHPLAASHSSSGGQRSWFGISSQRAPGGPPCTAVPYRQPRRLNRRWPSRVRKRRPRIQASRCTPRRRRHTLPRRPLMQPEPTTHLAGIAQSSSGIGSPHDRDQARCTGSVVQTEGVVARRRSRRQNPSSCRRPRRRCTPARRRTRKRTDVATQPLPSRQTSSSPQRWSRQERESSTAGSHQSAVQAISVLAGARSPGSHPVDARGSSSHGPRRDRIGRDARNTASPSSPSAPSPSRPSRPSASAPSVDVAGISGDIAAARNHTLRPRRSRRERRPGTGLLEGRERSWRTSLPARFRNRTTPHRPRSFSKTRRRSNYGPPSGLRSRSKAGNVPGPDGAAAPVPWVGRPLPRACARLGFFRAFMALPIRRPEASCDTGTPRSQRVPGDAASGRFTRRTHVAAKLHGGTR